jgi:hypothetical protein
MYSFRVALQIFLAIGQMGWILGTKGLSAIAVAWSFCLYRNDKVFNNKNSSIMQAIYWCTALLRSWSPLLRLGDRNLFMKVSTRLENTAMEFISPHG